jgi:D-amino-acid oxidase
MAKKAMVVGCGVIGLSSAIRLQEAGFEVSIITRDLPPNVTSAVAGAIWYAYGSHPRVRRWAEHSLETYLQLAQDPQSGVLIRRMREVFPHQQTDPWFKSRLPFFERIPAADLSIGFDDGFLMDIPIIETPKYLQYLVERFNQAGGQIEQRALSSLDELIDRYPLIVHCTGVGARQVVNDPDVYPIRGQVLKINAPHIQQGYMDDHHFTYIFPRGDGVILGGIAQPGNWSLVADPIISADILGRCAEVEPSVRSAPIIGALVGLRPGRHQVRLEVEQIGSSAVIHNYGHAGVGVTLSWGCAQEVVQLARQSARG